jgi:outer membrane receptor protein involved in Fe transport
MLTALRRAAPFVVLSLSLSLSPVVAFAQATGSVRGTVSAASQSTPVVGARVAIQSPARIALTDPTGRYLLRNLPVGRYDLVVTAVGYQPLHREINVTAGAPVVVDLALSPGSLMLSSVVTTATRSPVEAGKLAGTVNVLTPRQIETSAARESQDLLREIPSVELPRTSSLVGGTAQIVSIRGVDEGRTAVLFDGIPVNDAWGEWIDWGRVPKGMLDRVEVVEGGTSNLYGNGAMGGVISFFSRPMSPGSARMTVEGGSRDTRHVFGAVGIPLVGALTANVSGDYQSGGGYTLLDSAKRGVVDVPSQVIQRNAYARLTYAPSARFTAFVTGHAFGDSRELGTPLAFQSRDQRNVDMGVDVGGSRGLLSFRAWDGLQTEHQRSTTIRTGGRAFEDSSIVADIPSHDWGASAIWTRMGLLHLESFSVGGDYRHYNGTFDEANFNTTCPGANCGVVTRTILSGGDQALSGAFVQAVAAPFTPLRVELSARVDRWDNTNGLSRDAVAGVTQYPDSSKTAFSPRIGVHYHLHPRLALHVAGYRAFRAPNLAELYRKQISATSITLPNPYLKDETAEGREVGFDWQPFNQVQLKGTYYVADYNGFNVPVTLAQADRPAACGTVTTCRTRLNVNKSRSEGIEAYIAIRPIQSVFISGSVNYDDARQQSGLTAATIGNKPHINRVPSPKQSVRASYTSARFGEYTGIWRHEGHTTTLQGAVLDPYTVVDMHVRRDVVRGLMGFLAVENVGNTRYQVNLAGTGAAALVSYGMPRTVRAGLTLTRD